MSERFTLRFLTPDDTPAAEGVRRLQRIAESSLPRLPDNTPVDGACPRTVRERILSPPAQPLPAVDLLEIDSATVFGRGLVCLRDQSLLCGEYFNPGMMGRDGPQLAPWLPEGAPLDHPPLEVSGTCAVLSTPGDRIYGHWLLDLLYRVLALETWAPPDHYFLASDVGAFAADLLEACGVDRPRIRRFDPHTRCLFVERLRHVTSARHQGWLHPVVAEGLPQRLVVRTDLPQVPRRRLYISRRAMDQNGRVLLNREAVEARFADAGFEILQPEQLSISEQLALFPQASVIGGESGSGLHNALFMLPGTRCLVLQSRSNGNLLQLGIGGAKHQQVGYFFGESLARSVADRTADWVVDLDHLDRWLARSAGGVAAFGGR